MRSVNRWGNEFVFDNQHVHGAVFPILFAYLNVHAIYKNPAKIYNYFNKILYLHT